jgi:hypothetical protein
MSATIASIRAHPRPRELRASDGFGSLATLPPQRRRPTGCFCLDATTWWRSATPSPESSHPDASTSPAENGERAAREARNIL